MDAIAVTPGKPDSARIVRVPKPSLSGVPDSRGVLVKVLEVGVDGTDREINAGEYGAAPSGADYLILGHEGFGVVEDIAAHVTELRPGDYVVALVRKPGTSLYDLVGMPDMTTDKDYMEHGINLCHGFLTEYYTDRPEHLVRVPSGLRHVGVLLEPTSVVEKGIAQAYEIQRRMKVWQPGRALVLGAGTLGLLATLVLRLQGLDVTSYALREPPYLNSKLVETLGARYFSANQNTLAEVSRHHGPFDLIFEAAGYAPLTFEAMEILAINGVLVLTGLSGGDRRVEVPAEAIARGFVLGNKVVVGSVNGNRAHFEAGIRDLATAEATYAGWLSDLITHRITGLKSYATIFDLLKNGRDAIKVLVEVAPE